MFEQESASRPICVWFAPGSDRFLATGRRGLYVRLGDSGLVDERALDQVLEGALSESAVQVAMRRTVAMVLSMGISDFAVVDVRPEATAVVTAGAVSVQVITETESLVCSGDDSILTNERVVHGALKAYAVGPSADGPQHCAVPCWLNVSAVRVDYVQQRDDLGSGDRLRASADFANHVQDLLPVSSSIAAGPVADVVGLSRASDQSDPTDSRCTAEAEVRLFDDGGFVAAPADVAAFVEIDLSSTNDVMDEDLTVWPSAGLPNSGVVERNRSLALGPQGRSSGEESDARGQQSGGFTSVEIQSPSLEPIARPTERQAAQPEPRIAPEAVRNLGRSSVSEDWQPPEAGFERDTFGGSQLSPIRLPNHSTTVTWASPESNADDDDEEVDVDVDSTVYGAVGGAGAVGRVRMPTRPAEDNLVFGAWCTNRHFGPSTIQFCVRCGGEVDITTADHHDRPSLGVLMFDDGRRLDLDAPVLVGRKLAGVPVGIEQLIEFPDDKKLSRVHLEIRLIDWDVVVVDRQSINGTLLESSTGPRNLRPNRAEELHQGDRLLFGSHSCSFEAVS